MAEPINAYDSVAYLSHPFSFTHPSRIGALGVMFGLDCAPPSKARVLEIGCGEGLNLASIAYTLPGGEFVGVDLSEKQIGAGKEIIAAAGLKNIRLEQLDFVKLDESFGTFDYILCHGVYSWITPEMRSRLLETCSARLTENGVAYISYNTLPGWYHRLMLREMLLYHAEQFRDDPMFVPQARAMVTLLQKALGTNKAPLAEFMRNTLKQVEGHPDWYLRHDVLEEINEPVYFHHFAAALEPAGLQYLADSDLSKMVDYGFSEEVRGALRGLSDDIVRYEQYLDFLRNRSFRRSLVCRKSVTLSRSDAWTRISKLQVMSLLKRKGETESGVTRYETPEGGFMETNDPFMLEVLDRLAAAAPQSIPFSSLLEGAENPQAETERLGKSLFQLAARNLVELTTETFPFVTSVSERPVASGLARCQLSRGAAVSNLRHELVALDPLEKRLTALLDGSRTVDEAITESGESGENVASAVARMTERAMLLS